MELIPLGSVISVFKDQVVVVKIDNPSRIPELGSRAYHKRGLRQVGIVSDIIGPTREPYAVIKMIQGASVSVGEELVYEPRRRKRVR
ncbi:MAG: hypothetical protein QXI22_00040 [Sulfolobales archaeon]